MPTGTTLVLLLVGVFSLSAIGSGFLIVKNDLDSSSSSSASNPFQIIYEWRFLDFDFPSYESRVAAIKSGKFIPENNLPLGIDVLGDRIFVTTPRWKGGVPASLVWLPRVPQERSPPLRPYPDWSAHGDPENPDCSKLMSVYRTFIDECDRLWIIDAGVVNATIQLNQVCLPKIVIYDLRTDSLVTSYELPANQVKEDSLHSNIVVEVRNGQCQDAYAYVTDVWRYGLVVYSLATQRSWRITHHLFHPSPFAADFNLHALNFQWVDGVFGMSLLRLNGGPRPDVAMFYHPMASYNEFMIASTSILQNEALWTNGSASDMADAIKSFVKIGDRGDRGQSTTVGIDRRNIMFFTLVSQDAIGCWNTATAYTKQNMARVAQNATTLYFPNDLKVDREQDQGVWVISNRLPTYLYAQLNYDDVNFRIQRASVAEATRGTVCDTLGSQNDFQLYA